MTHIKIMDTDIDRRWQTQFRASLANCCHRHCLIVQRNRTSTYKNLRGSSIFILSIIIIVQVISNSLTPRLPTVQALTVTAPAADAAKQNNQERTTPRQSKNNMPHLVDTTSLKSLIIDKQQDLSLEQTSKTTATAATAEAETLLTVNDGQGLTSDRRAFVVELLKMLHEQYGSTNGNENGKLAAAAAVAATSDEPLDRRSLPSDGARFGATSLYQLLEAIGADGDIRRLIDWVRNSFNMASVSELTTQFVVSKLGSINCPAIFKPDKEEALVPRFLLFNEHFVDVPFELSIAPSASECLVNGKFDPARKTIILIHGYLTGYTIVDGITNIKNRLLDLNMLASEKAIDTFLRASESHSNGSYVFTEDLGKKIRQQLYNVIIVDWYTGANPKPRSNYIKAAVNAQVVGKLIARFLSALIVKCSTPASNLQIVAHSLGCHVSGFTGKAMNAAGHRLGKITHLDPVGLCFGRLFSQPRFRLNPSDALDTQAVHVSLNLFDNPLDGAQSNFLVNGGRDQLGCDGQAELQNSTTTSVSLLFDPAARFGPCSHLRALALFEDDHSSEPDQCQFVGYRCQSYERFLAGKCGQCDATNSQCRLMGIAPLSMQFRKLNIATNYDQYNGNKAITNHHKLYSAYNQWDDDDSLNHGDSAPIGVSVPYNRTTTTTVAATTTTTTSHEHQANKTSRKAAVKQQHQQQLSSLWAPSPTNGSRVESAALSMSPTRSPSSSKSSTKMFGAPAYIVSDYRSDGDDYKYSNDDNNDLKARSDRHLLLDKRERIAQAIEKLRTETRSAIVGSLTSFRGAPSVVGLASELPLSSKEIEGNHLAETSGSEQDSDDAHHQHQHMSTTASIKAVPTTTSPPTQSPPPLDVKYETSKLMIDNAPDCAAKQSGAAATSSQQRLHQDPIDKPPLGSQAIPAGSQNGPQFYLGTGAASPYCVNYYQFRVLIAESRLKHVIKNKGLAPNRLAPQYSQHGGHIIGAAASLPQRAAHANGRDMLHLTVKLTDTLGHFFKGFSLLEHASSLSRVLNDFIVPQPMPASFGAGPAIGPNEPMVELTLLLNTTKAQPVKIGETILSYYFHPIVLADRVEVNYMSNISPDIRAKYSSALCPVAINDRHQLVKYIECNRVPTAARRK